MYLSIDATLALHEYGLGRYINHSKKSCNMKAVLVKDNSDNFRLCFFSKWNIKAGEELSINYGDNRREIIKQFTWLAQ